MRKIQALRKFFRQWLIAAWNPSRAEFERFRSEMHCESAQTYEEVARMLEARLLAWAGEGAKLLIPKVCEGCQYFSESGALSELPCAVNPTGPVNDRCSDFKPISLEGS